MTPDQTISGLRALAGELEDRKDIDLVMGAVEKIDALGKACLQLGIYIKGEEAWKFPLGDGVYVEVKIHGQYKKSHVKRFAALFSAVAENYQAEAENPSKTEAPEIQPQPDQE